MHDAIFACTILLTCACILWLTFQVFVAGDDAVDGVGDEMEVRSRERVCVCEREREREGVCLCVCLYKMTVMSWLHCVVCVCVCMRERWREGVSVCVSVYVTVCVYVQDDSDELVPLFSVCVCACVCVG